MFREDCELLIEIIPTSHSSYGKRISRATQAAKLTIVKKMQAPTQLYEVPYDIPKTMVLELKSPSERQQMKKVRNCRTIAPMFNF
ncbi:hypothetical protein PFISCL1PPCAC_11532, partial [Pristionchus fissidentatus]